MLPFPIERSYWANLSSSFKMNLVEHRDRESIAGTPSFVEADRVEVLVRLYQEQGASVISRVHARNFAPQSVLCFDEEWERGFRDPA